MKPRTLKILIADDSMIARKLARKMLETCEFPKEIFEAEDGFEALVQVEKIPRIDIILLDVDMPRQNGIQVLQNMQEQLHLEHWPRVIMVSAMADEQTVYKAKFHGARAFLGKPISKQKLLSELEDLIAA